MVTRCLWCSSDNDDEFHWPSAREGKPELLAAALGVTDKMLVISEGPVNEIVYEEEEESNISFEFDSPPKRAVRKSGLRVAS